jgi:hypothetical protein
MCYYEDVFSHACKHGGRRRFVGEPCCRSRIVNGRHTGCYELINFGSANSSELCRDCKYREEAHTTGWKPFSQVSNDGWAVVEQKFRRRSEDLGNISHTGMKNLPSQMTSYMIDERFR